MMKSIRYIFFALMGSMFALSLALIFVTWRAQMTSQALSTQIEQMSSQSLLMNELKYSVELADQFARNYVHTQDTKWRDLYDHLLAIRKGFSPIPSNYTFDYWSQLSDPSVIFTLPLPSFRPEHPTLFSRLRESGVSESQMVYLNPALDVLDGVESHQNRAMNLLQGKKITPRGIERIIPDADQAQMLLHEPEHTFKLTQVLGSIGAFNQNLMQQNQLKHQALKKRAQQLGQWSNLMALILVVGLLLTTMLLWRRFLRPIEQIRRAIVGHVQQRSFEFKLAVEDKGELKDLAIAQNQVLSEIADQFEFNRQIKAFSDLIRGCADTEQLGREVSQFLSRKLKVPYVISYIYQDTKLTAIGRNQPDTSAEVNLSIAQDCHATVVRNHQTLRISGSPDGFKVILPECDLLLEELIFFPLLIHKELVGILEIGAMRQLSDADFNWIETMSEDLAVSIQLTQNAQLQRQAELRVSEQLKLNEQIINAMPNPIYYRDGEGNYAGVNNKFLEFIGKEKTVIGFEPEAIFPQEIADIFTHHAQQLMMNPSLTHYEIELENAQGSMRNVMVHEATYFDTLGRPNGVVGIFVDITEHKQLTLDLTLASERAKEASEAKGEFLANMSHEIRTPMNAVLGMSHLALQTPLQPQQRNYIQQIEKAGKNLLQIINDILDVSKIEAGKMGIEQAPFRLSDVIDNVTNILSMKTHEKKLELVLNIAPEVPEHLFGDSLRLGQILINLGGNAVKFTDQGEIIISVFPLEQTEKTVCLQFEVQDSGIGMTEAQLSRLFQAFTQADNSVTRNYGGTGLGLNICKQLVALMGGKIWVKSEPEQGSCFSFYVHLGISENSHQWSHASMDQIQDKRVLVVDDNQASRKIFSSLLKMMKLNVNAVADGQSALNAVTEADESEKNFDFIVMDWKMPLMMGDETASQIRQLPLTSQPKILLASAYGDDSVLDDPAFHQLFDARITKPVTPSSLLDALLNMLGPVIQGTQDVSFSNHPDTNYDFHHARILIVEDNQVNQEVAIGILQPYGAHIETADHGEIALRKLQQSNYDLVLMDMQMPVMDGLTATRKIRTIEKLKALPVIAMTANAMEKDVARCFAAGMNAHITKPICPDEFLSKIQMGLLGKLPAQLSAIDSEGVVLQSQDEFMVLDIDEGVARMAGQAQTYWRIVSLFIETRHVELEALNRAVEEQDINEVKKLAHACKGASANISALKMMHTAAELEKSPEVNAALKVEALFLQLSEIQKIYGNQNHEKSLVQDGGLPQLDELSLLQALFSIKKSIQATDLNVLEKLESLLPRCGYTSEIQFIIDAVNEFEFEKASSLCEQLEEKLNGGEEGRAKLFS